MKLKKERGITLIALVVTIIVLIILAGVSINLLFGQYGIITKAKQSKEAQIEAEVREKVSIILAEYAIEREYNNKTLSAFLEEKKSSEEIDEVITNEDGTITVELNGFAVVIDTNLLSIISIDKDGKIVRIKLSATTAKLNETITARVSFEEDIDYTKCKWIYSTDLQVGTNEASYPNTFTSLENIINLTSTEQNIYYLHILVVDKEGNKTEKISVAINVQNLVSSITLDKTEITMGEGREVTLIATVEPNDAYNKWIEWTSNDETIATVDETGKITALKIGNTIITATAKDGSGVKATCTVYVKEKLYMIESGKDNTEITGGWEGIPYYGRETGTMIFTDNGYVEYNGTNEKTVYIKATVNPIDWSKYKSVNVKVKAKDFLQGYENYGSISIGIVNSKSNIPSTAGVNSKYLTIEQAAPEEGEEIIISAEIPEIYTENTYIAIGVHRCSADIYDIWLEP